MAGRDVHQYEHSDIRRAALPGRVILTRPSPFAFLEADVYLITGQSQAVGRAPLAALPASLSGTRPSAFIWNGSEFVNLQAQTTSGYPSAGNDWGAEMLLAELAAAKQGRPVFIVKVAVPNISLLAASGTTWNPDVSGSLADSLDSNIREARAWLRGKGRLPVFRGMVWLQGEADSKAANGAAYETKQTTLFNRVRALVGNNALPILDGMVRTEFAEYTNAADINTAKANVASALGNIRLLKTNAFNDIGDDVHYDGPGFLAAGRHAFEYFHGQTVMPASLPARAFELDTSRQQGFELSGVMLTNQLNDLSGNARHFVQATGTRQPTLLEGPLALGIGTARLTSGKGFDGPTDPFAADSAYTVYFVLANFLNPTANAVRTVIRSLLGTSWLIWFPNASPFNRLTLRHNTTTILQSSVASDASVQVCVIRYAGAAGNTMRINGAQVASSTLATGHAAAGALAVGGYATATINADLPAVGGFDGYLDDANTQLLEGYLAWRFGATLASGHPYASAPPA